jgi:AcrR family transcriptional regulator
MVVRNDWLVGGDRSTAAAERIYAAATDVVARRGPEALDIDELAARLHCSRATIYRHAGGKSEIRDAVVLRGAARIIEKVRVAVGELSGAERIVTAITLALREIRTDPLGQLMITSIRAQEMSWLTDSPIVAGVATDINGLTDDDPEAVQWIIRIVLTLMYWPIGEPDVERHFVERFVSPAFRS